MHLVNVVYRSGRVVRWDAKKELCIGDEDANKLLCRSYRAPWGQYVRRYLSPEHRT